MAAKEGKTKYYTLMENSEKQDPVRDALSGRQASQRKPVGGRVWSQPHTVRKALICWQGKATFIRTGPRDLLLREAPPYETVSQYRGSDHLYYGYIFPRLIQGMDHVLSSNGYSIILKSTGNSRKLEAQALEDILKKDVDGVIIEPSKSQLVCRHEHLYRLLEEYQIPYIFIQGIYEQWRTDPISS